MPATDVEQQLREALVTILEADATLISLMGGAARVVDRQTLGPASVLPCLAYDVLSYSDADGRATVLLTGLDTTPETAPSVARHLVKAAADALTQTAFAGQALDVAASERQNQNVADVGLIDLGNPNLRQADAILPLLVV